MTGIGSALERNRDFAAANGHEGAVVFPDLGLFVVTCLDPRVDPAHFLGLGLGDAVVVRNVGGRVTPEVINDVAFIGQIAQSVLPDGPLFEVAVIHHTQCGSAALADDAVSALLRATHPPTALFTGRDAVTVAALRALHRMGLQRLVAVVGFGDFVTADLLSPGVTVVAQDPGGIGRRAAYLLFARMEGILLDPVYTGRAAAGMLDLIRQGVITADQKVLFWHTGGTPAIFAYPERLVAS